MSRRLPSIPLRLAVGCDVWTAPWIVDRLKGDWRLTPPQTDLYSADDADAGEYLSALMNVKSVQEMQKFLSRCWQPVSIFAIGKSACEANDQLTHWSRTYVLGMCQTTFLLLLEGTDRPAEGIGVGTIKPPKLPNKLSGLSVDLIVLEGKLVAECHETNGARACFCAVMFRQVSRNNLRLVCAC